MAVTIQLPDDVEDRLRGETPDLESQAKEVLAIELFRRGRISHFELSKMLGLDRFETNAFLKRHQVLEGSLTNDDLDEQAKALERAIGLSAG